MSNNQKKYLKKKKQEQFLILFFQISLVIIFFGIWQLLADKKIINSFLFSSPKKIIMCIINLTKNNLLSHIATTLYEVFIAFTLGIIFGFIIAIILYEFKLLAKIIDPFLTMINSLPKVALGPLIIILIGANAKSIITMALLINLIVSIITIYNGFLNIDNTKIKLFQAYKASKKQILYMLIIPSSYKTIISSLKLNISMSLIGVIMGEFLVSKRGIGYLIIYGTQIFNLDIVITGIFILALISFVLYKFVQTIEQKLVK